MKKYRKQKNYSIRELAGKTALSEKYLYNIEREGVFNLQEKKNISLRKLRNIIIALSVESDLETVDYAVLKDLLFSAIGLDYYQDAFLHIETDRSKMIINKGENISRLYLDQINEINGDRVHLYEIWALGYPATESAISNLSRNVLDCHIKHSFFLYETENIKPIVSFIKYTMSEDLDNSNEKSNYWRTENWRDYIKIYILPEIIFFNDFTLYNPNEYSVSGIFHLDSSLEKPLNIKMTTEVAKGYTQKLKDTLMNVLLLDWGYELAL